MADPELVVRLELLKRDIARFKSYRLASSYMTSTDGWEIATYDEDRDKLRGLELQPVEISLDNQQQLLGRIDVTEVGGDGSAVTLRGRDYLADLVECNVDPALQIKDAMTVADALTLACGPVGIDAILADSDIPIRNIRTGKGLRGAAGADSSFKEAKLDDYKPTPGEGLFEFCNKIVARHGATLQPADARNKLLISTPDYKQAPLYALRRSAKLPAGAANNIITAVAVRDYSRLPTIALLTGKGGPAGTEKSGLSMQIDMKKLTEEFNTELRGISDVIFELSGKLARRKPGEPAGLATGLLYRLLYHRDEDSRNQAQLEKAAKRAVAERLKDTLSYRVTLQGHSDPDTGAFWAVNTLVDVQDDITGIREPLWIESRTFTGNLSDGARTELECWRPESFQIA